MNLCRVCGQDFGSVSAFDAHRVGVHAYTYRQGLEQGRTDGRRCLDLDEYEARTLVRNKLGRWSIGKDLARARNRNSGGQ